METSSQKGVTFVSKLAKMVIATALVLCCATPLNTLACFNCPVCIKAGVQEEGQYPEPPVVWQEIQEYSYGLDNWNDLPAIYLLKKDRQTVQGILEDPEGGYIWEVIPDEDVWVLDGSYAMIWIDGIETD